MALAARLAGQDAVQLIRMGAGISLALTETPGFSYNFPLMLFGVVAVELGSTSPEQLFLTLTAISGIFDIISFMTRASTFPGTIFALVLFVIKAPIYFSGVVHLRERGGELAWSNRGFAGPGGWVPSFGGQAGGQTLGGQTLGGGLPTQQPSSSASPPPPGAFPSGGGYRLGSGEPQPPKTRDGYSQIA